MESLITHLGVSALGTLLGLIGTVLGLIGTASAVVLSWKNARRQADANKREANSQAIDDLDQVRKALMEEIGRLSAKVDCLKQENEQLRAENKALREKVGLLEKRVEELEAEHKRLRCLR
jgi:peptidoglycan hydrolase CwlO-like protein